MTGGGGAPLYPSGTSTLDRVQRSRNEYVKLTVDACTLTLNAIGLDGAAFDWAHVALHGGQRAPDSLVDEPCEWVHDDLAGRIALTADASDTDGTIARVDFFAGQTLDRQRLQRAIRDNVDERASGYLRRHGSGNRQLGNIHDVCTGVRNGHRGTAAERLEQRRYRDDGRNRQHDCDVDRFLRYRSRSRRVGHLRRASYAYKTLTGDGSIVARVVSEQNVANWTKAGVMIRNSLSPSAAQAFMLVSPGKGRRSSGGSPTAPQA